MNLPAVTWLYYPVPNIRINEEIVEIGEKYTFNKSKHVLEGSSTYYLFIKAIVTGFLLDMILIQSDISVNR